MDQRTKAVKVVLQNKRFKKNLLGNLPASIKSTFQCGTSDKRDATTDPPEPPPTTMKSYSASGNWRACLDFISKNNFRFYTQNYS